MSLLLAGALVTCVATSARAQGLLTVTAGFRGGTGERYQGIRGGPLLGVDVRPIRWGWGALGVEASLAPRIARRDSGAYNPPGQGCYGPGGVLTTCASIRNILGETTTQVGIIASFGPTRPRTAPFAELGLGWYRAGPNNQTDIWDPNGTHLTNLSGTDRSAKAGVYARLGAGVRMKPWARGPALSLSARYRWAKLGGFDDWFEGRNDRSGLELVLGVRF
jgi:hypothetical protein